MDARFVDDDASFAALIDELRDEPVYGIDTEFHRERTYYPLLALVQISWSGGLALIDPFAVDIRPLRTILEGPGVAILHAAGQDLDILLAETGAVPTTLFDPQIAAAFLGYGTTSLGNLVADLLGVNLDKSDQLADWTARPLPERAQRYAASDVEHLLSLRDELLRRLDARGRRAWAEEECERLRTKDRNPSDPNTAWWRIKGKGRLSGRSRGVAQEVAAWRERTAMADNRIAKHILPDMAMLIIAQRPPKALAHLRKIRGLDPRRHLANGMGEAILDAVQRGLALDPQDVVLPPQGRADRGGHAVVTLALAWLTQVAEDEHIDPPLLATRDELGDFLHGDGAPRIRSGWRHALLGADLERLFAGACAITSGADMRLTMVAPAREVEDERQGS